MPGAVSKQNHIPNRCKPENETLISSCAKAVEQVPRDAGGETAQAYREAFLNVVRVPDCDGS